MEEPRRRPPPGLPRLRVTLLLFWVAGFYLLFALLFVLPHLLEGLRSLPAGTGPASPEELRGMGREIARNALAPWQLYFCFAAAVAAAALGAWYGVLPGYRKDAPGRRDHRRGTGRG